MPLTRICGISVPDNSTVKNFNQPTPTFGPYDPPAPRATPDTSTPARQTAVAIEEGIRNNKLETGVFIGADGKELLRRTGQPNRVGFAEAELAGKAGSTFTHNHPGDGAFSLDDYEAALFAQVAELRVVSPQFRHLLLFGAAPPTRKTLEQLGAEWSAQLSEVVRQANQADQLHPAWFGVELQHAFWKRAAKRFGLTYLRERS